MEEATFTVASQQEDFEGTGYVAVEKIGPLDTPNEGINRLAQELIEHHDKRTTHMAPEIMNLDVVDVYGNEERHRAEVALFKRIPLVIGVSAEMREPGSFKTLNMLGLPLLITRDKAGVLHTFLNACTHRGAPLTNQPCGKAARFTCPYHAWTFGNDGGLIAVNSSDQFGDVDKSSKGLVELPCTEKAGLIFAILTPGLELDVDAFYEGMLDEIARYGYEDWHYLGTMDVKAANWKFGVEGFLETYHVPVLHKTTLNQIASGGRPPAQAFQSFGPHMRFVTATGQALEDMRSVDPKDYWTRELNNFRAIYNLFPNVAVPTGFDVIQIMTMIPGATPGEHTTIFHHITPKAPETEDEAAQLELNRQALVRIIVDEDYYINALVQQVANGDASFPLMFGRNEVGLQHFHKSLNWFLDGDANAPRPEISTSTHK
ncbi:phenylpropionate dioxygenase-like ring-hydroxylating dioxygenase large terminal subunit [Novosphingobium hassiacum]|uniref:Phenylpropionate dioxygenase-like ring-hydroxylating dioxygenase large terminal subunit n=1 Tax=Novosphingobium hassiacum TaxID=173676 RepID=A0A7W6EW39_9SPHN|nr:aromatic ring-hydroxylating dioxygenase subunit alpha [Novosphingobium hassiacum]MBB3860928.1 phenylpropionate dioxygenase-like ring-hydroxylating dioxygenase large terminal subunit [Novosphingobium hassiacum]